MAAVITIPAKMSATVTATAHNGDSTHHQDQVISCASLRAANTTLSNTAVPGKLTPREGLPAIPGTPFPGPTAYLRYPAEPVRMRALASITQVAGPVSVSARMARRTVPFEMRKLIGVVAGGTRAHTVPGAWVTRCISLVMAAQQCVIRRA